MEETIETEYPILGPMEMKGQLVGCMYCVECSEWAYRVFEGNSLCEECFKLKRNE